VEVGEEVDSVEVKQHSVTAPLAEPTTATNLLKAKARMVLEPSQVAPRALLVPDVVAVVEIVPAEVVIDM
jgi:hypothetical protein